MFNSKEFANNANHAASSILHKYFSTQKLESVRWDSDFDHASNWEVVPIYLNYLWAIQEMHTFEHPLASLGKGIFVESLNSTAIDRFGDAISHLKNYIETGLINYIGVSRLPARTILKPHAHQNVGNLKLHCSVFCPPACGLMYTDKSGLTKIHQWPQTTSSIYFNDNNMHSAWNNSEIDRYVLILDFNAQLLSDHRSIKDV